MEQRIRQEFRFALVLFGGVSLAVYMNGVVQEFLHLVRSTAAEPASGTERVYRELGELVGARFVVDIASGSSAGGINAIFLGKALANGQSPEHLAKLWIEEADLHRLWNRDRVPRSLLSAEFLYDKLIGALEAMDGGGNSGALQPEMDVFITATDVRGLDLPIELTDKTVSERRYKSVFRFHFRDDGPGDFGVGKNPLLAFAARATSALPFAFEPAQIAGRTFADGGLLNNKPFSHAIRQLPQSPSDVPTRRMLVYVEPSPDAAGVTGLPGLTRVETVREDLEKILERNRLIERVREATDHVERDVTLWQASGKTVARRRSGPEYAQRSVAEEVHERGPGYAAYHRLKVRAVTDEIAGVLGSEIGAIAAWRSRTYGPTGENRFLLEFDIGYRIRRVRALLAKLDQPGELRSRLSAIARDFERVRERGYNSGGLEKSAEVLRREIRHVTDPAAQEMERCLKGQPLQPLFEHYEYYDQVTFPILYETQVGQPEHVEVYRISPADARSPHGLAGTALLHFAAFLKREWRVHDMLCGRLDAAERIITAVLPPGSEHAARLIEQARQAILGDREGGAMPPRMSRAVGLRQWIGIAARMGWIGSKMLWGMVVRMLRDQARRRLKL